MRNLHNLRKWLSQLLRSFFSISLIRKAELLSSLAILIVTAVCLGSYYFIQSRFELFEQEQEYQSLSRIQNMLASQLTALDEGLYDWSSWDDNYEFVTAGSDDFISTNLEDSTLHNSRLNLIIIIDKEGRQKFKRIIDLDEDRPIELSKFQKRKYEKEHFLIKQTKGQSSIKGFILTEAGPMLIVSREIFNSAENVAPAGVMIFGRLMNASYLESIENHLMQDLTFVDVMDSTTSKHPDSGNVIREWGKTRILQNINLLDSKDKLLLQVILDRRLAVQGNLSLRWLILIFFFTTCSILLVIRWMMITTIVKPITMLSEEMSKSEISNPQTSDILLHRNDEIGRVFRSYYALVERIHQKLTEQRLFNHAISHELRTPLARLRFALDLSRETKNTEHDTDYIFEMDDDISELESLLDELLSYAHLSSGEAISELTSCELGTIIHDVVDKLSHAHKGIKINIELISIALMVDEKKLTRALSNLVANGLRYASSAIKICLIESHDSVQLRISDDGVGIDQAHAERIFLPFYRVDRSRNKDSGGFGLGLAIAHQALENMGAQLSLEPCSEGACFKINWKKVPGKTNFE